ncbi:murein transglycosylase A [Legionella sp. CNM-4043-24]|uniref:murein transglycosylase A n=1 Tax=Legionella sp. CNM-4043-24 TaxID=3421646 RepID=UPI00403B0727
MKHKIFYTIVVISMLLLVSTLWKTKPDVIHIKTSRFNQLPGWDAADIEQSFKAFQISCKAFLRQDPERPVGSQQIPMQAKDWQPACMAAANVKPVSEANARKFFRRWFQPVEFYDSKPVQGLFTGYYLPLLHGSMTRSEEYNVPIYGLPSNIVTVNLSDFGSDLPHRRLVGRMEQNRFVPFHNRAEINKGALKDKAPVLVWVNSHIDRLFLEIQGSGVVQLDTGEKIYLGYAGENGGSYTPVGKVLIDRGIMTKKTASMQGIRAYLEAHPDEILPVLNQNKSFVFFQILKRTAAMGAQGVELTPGYSLAVDRKWIPLGTPLWLNTTHPRTDRDEAQSLQRLMIAQDTGGAIRGAVRGDVFWGAGEDATYIAGKMKNAGHYWLLLPKHRVRTLAKSFN